MTPRTLDVHEAAKLLRVHPQTLMMRARAGAIPGAKVGRAWVFVESLLLEHLMAQSLSRVSVADALEFSECRSTDEKIRLHGGSNSRQSLARVEGLYRSALGLPTNVGHRSSTTGSKPNGGNRPS